MTPKRDVILALAFPLVVFFIWDSPLFAIQSYAPSIVDPLLEPWRWYHIEELDGMGFQCMAQEPNGVMWFGLKEGVMRYDGRHWHQFNLDAGLTPLSKRILSTPEGLIYLQTSQAIHLYQEKRWITILKQSYLGFPGQGMVADAEGDVWAAGADGLWHIKSHNAELVERIEGGVTTVFVDSCHQLWWLPSDYRVAYRAPLRNGKLGLKAERESFFLYPRDRKRQGTIMETKDGHIWIASDTSSDPVHIFDTATQTWSQIDLGTTLSRYTCTDMALTEDGKVWLIGQGKLHAWHDGTERIYTTVDLKIPSSRSALLAGVDGSLWIGGMTAQVYRIDYSDRQYVTYQNLHYQCESPSGIRWFLAKTGSVVQQDTESDRWQQFGPTDNLPDAPVVLSTSKDGSVWAAGSHQGDAAVARYDGGQWQRWVFPQLAFGISPYSVLETASGDMLFGSASHQAWDASRQGGLLRFYRNAQVYECEHQTYPRVPFRIVGIAQTQEGLWFGGSYLARFDGEHTQRIQTPMSLAADWVDHVTQSTDGHLWVAKGGDGVFHYDGHTWQQYTMEQGLASNMVSYVCADPDNTLWAATDNGISRFDGLQWQTLALPEAFKIDRESGSLRVSPDGAVWVNRAARSWYFRALDPTIGALPSDDLFLTTRYRPDDKPPNTSIDFFLARTPSATPVRITWTGRDAWSVTPKDQLLYTHRLDEGPWSDFSPETTHTWYDLPTGNHVFEVRARDWDLNIDPTPARIAFTVLLPTWLQPWFILLIGSLLLAIAVLMVRLVRAHEAHVTQQLQFEKQQTQQQLEIDESRLAFFTNISHELRTPLTLITGPLETLLAKLQDTGLKDQALLAKRNADRLLQLVNQLLDIRKLQAGKLRLQLMEDDVIRFVGKLVASLQSAATQKQLTLSFESSVSHLTTAFDADKLEKILVNLISNAVKFTPQGGNVTVTTRSVNAQLQLTVEDNGIGIPPDQLECVFERFHRVNPQGQPSGSGIGLSLARELVQLHGGTIRVISPVHTQECDHPGSRFVVWLPLRTVPEANPVDLAIEQEEDLHDVDALPAILIVEDNDDMRHYVISILAAEYQLMEAADGLQGLQLAREKLPDLIISDIMMPEMDGIELCRLLKHDENTSHIPIILLTAKGSEAAQVEGLETGADDYVVKPFSQAVLQARLANLLESRRRLQAHFQKDLIVQPQKIADNPVDERFLKRALDIVEAHLSDYDFAMNAFSSLMHMSRSTLYRKLKALTGQSPSVFIRTIRLKHAARLLKTGRYHISEVAYQVGFLDMSYFGACFKEQFHCSPSQFMSQHNVLEES